MSSIPAVADSVWSDLFKAADAFRELAPWEFMEGGDILSVANPEKKEAGYCCVMGQLGEVFGMAVYLGSDGLACMEELFAEEGPPNPVDAILKKRCLMIEFVGSGDLEKEDKAITKRLGLKYRGSNAWPTFRSIRPGEAPWFLEEWEARYLIHALQQAVEVYRRSEENPGLLVPDRDGIYFTRVPAFKDGIIEWTDQWIQPEPFVKPDLPKLDFDEIRFAAAKKKVKHFDLAWEMDLPVIPMPLMDHERPYFPRMFMMADQKSGYMFGAEPLDPTQCNGMLLPKIIDIIDKTGVMPKTIRLRNGELRALLNNPLNRMGIEAKYVRELPAIDEAYAGRMQFFGGL